jgi:hypothetical protein
MYRYISIHMSLLFLKIVPYKCMKQEMYTIFTQMQDDSNLRQPPKNKMSANKILLLLYSYT